MLRAVPQEEPIMANKTTAAATSKAKAISLHIGLNGVSGAAYGGWDGPLAACEFDANDMAVIAKSRGMKSTVLLTKKGNRANVLAGMRSAAKALKAGDLFFMTYSGHGGQMPDVSGDEPDKKDETWWLYDGQLIDDELYFELSFNPACVLISGCQDNQTSMDGDHNGAFTEQLLKVWGQDTFKGNYGSFHARIKAGMPASQSPNLFTLGKAGAFLAQTPFTV
jgi:Caspase domain